MRKYQILFVILILILISVVSLIGCDDGPTGCIAEGTFIMTPTGDRLIEDLQIGDLVYSYDLSTKQMHASKIMFKKSSQQICYQFQITNEINLIATLSHPIFAPETNSYELAEKWVQNDLHDFALFSAEQSFSSSSLSSIKLVGQKTVYDITVESKHANFIASGVLVHNKSVVPMQTNPVDDLEIIAKSDSSLTLSWTVPGNNTVSAAEYVLWSSDSIDVSDGGWVVDSVPNMPTPKVFGSKDTLEISGLESQKAYLFMMQTLSNQNVLSDPGNSAIDTTL